MVKRLLQRKNIPPDPVEKTRSPLFFEREDCGSVVLEQAKRLTSKYKLLYSLIWMDVSVVLKPPVCTALTTNRLLTIVFAYKNSRPPASKPTRGSSYRAHTITQGQFTEPF